MIKEKENILFYGPNENSPAYKFYCQSFSRLEKYNLDLNLDYKKINSGFYKFIFLHTGYKKKININLIEKKSKMILVEPRPGHYNEIDKFDFIIVNSFETKLFYSKYKKPSIIYPPVYEYNNLKIKKKEDDILRFIYHGNSKHISYFRQKLEFVLNNIKTNKKKELHLIYDLKNKKVKIGKNCKEIVIHHHKHSHEKINEILARGGIGLVPQLIPENRNLFHLLSFVKFIKFFTELKNEYILRFKENSNLGRHLVFAQFKIPFVTEPTMSSCLFLNEKWKNLLSYNKYDWLNSVQYLIDNPVKMDKFGEDLHDNWKKNFSHKVLNLKLTEKIENLYENS